MEVKLAAQAVNFADLFAALRPPLVGSGWVQPSMEQAGIVECYWFSLTFIDFQQFLSIPTCD